MLTIAQFVNSLKFCVINLQMLYQGCFMYYINCMCDLNPITNVLMHCDWLQNVILNLEHKLSSSHDIKGPTSNV